MPEITITVSQEFLERLQKRADEDRRSRSAYIRLLLEDALLRKGGGK